MILRSAQLRQFKSDLRSVAPNATLATSRYNQLMLLSRSGINKVAIKCEGRLGNELREFVASRAIPAMEEGALAGVGIPKPVNGTAHASIDRAKINTLTISAEELYLRWCDGELRGALIQPQGWEIVGVEVKRHGAEELVYVACRYCETRPLRFELHEEVQIRYRELEPEKNAANGIPRHRRLASGSGPTPVNEVVTHQLGLAIAELESGHVEPVRTALRLELAEMVSGRDFGRYRERLLTTEFDDQTTLQRSPVPAANDDSDLIDEDPPEETGANDDSDLIDEDPPEATGLLEDAVVKLRAYLQTVRSASWKEAADATGLRRYLMKAAVAHMAAAGELDNGNRQLALRADRAAARSV
ncbi:MAG: hypothetical protein MJE77_38780 [Proteobacteria bacterium]|nr:hypothetical protein [Pseudomonadota bacterium]